MDIGESSSNYANDTSGMSGDTRLPKKSFDELFKTVVGLVERLRAQPRYTSKDCVIICNPSFDAKKERNLFKKL